MEPESQPPSQGSTNASTLVFGDGASVGDAGDLDSFEQKADVDVDRPVARILSEITAHGKDHGAVVITDDEDSDEAAIAEHKDNTAITKDEDKAVITCDRDKKAAPMPLSVKADMYMTATLGVIGGEIGAQKMPDGSPPAEVTDSKVEDSFEDSQLPESLGDYCSELTREAVKRSYTSAFSE